MTLALVVLCGMLVMVADLLFGVLPDRAAQTRDLRKSVVEALSVQVAALLEVGDQRTLQRTLSSVVAQSDSLRSIGIRQADGVLLMQMGEHQKAWEGDASGRFVPDQIGVTLSRGGERWGAFEVTFKPEGGGVIRHWLSEPLVVMLLFLSTLGTLVFALYMRRALQHLDPASVIPERVQGAFDAMAEGVAVLDARGRLLLANKAFAALHADARALRLGQALSGLPWFAGALPSDAAMHPWVKAMSERVASAGYTLELADDEQGKRRLVVNCAPIADPGGAVRGCLATFNDVSALHRTNEKLLQTLTALSAAKDEVQLKNQELERLATRDSLTGCLTRRAFNEAFEAKFEYARSAGLAISCVMLDIDHFKKVNDNFGHMVGDQVIQEVAKKLHDGSRSGDLVCRYGGEEFCIVVPGLDLVQAMEFAERMRRKVERECAAALRDVQGLSVTISIGVDALTPQVPSPAALIDRADQGLYQAKRSGRNQVCAIAMGEPEAEPAQPPVQDPLTGCLSRHGLDLALAAAVREGNGNDLLAGVTLRIDTMKAIREEHGSEVADLVFQQLGAALQRLAGGKDAVGRFGPDDFALLLPGWSLGEVSGFAEKLRQQLPAMVTAEIPSLQDLRVTLSLGVDALAAGSPGAATLLDRADRAKMRARHGGGNQVCWFGAEPAAKAAAASDAVSTDTATDAVQP